MQFVVIDVVNIRIEKLQVRNFKSFKDIIINFTDFNVIIGANSSGKSNLTQVIRFLRDVEDFGIEDAISLQGGIEYISNYGIKYRQPTTFSIDVSYNVKENENNQLRILSIKEGIDFVSSLDSFSYELELKFDPQMEKIAKTVEKITIICSNQETYPGVHPKTGGMILYDKNERRYGSESLITRVTITGTHRTKKPDFKAQVSRMKQDSDGELIVEDYASEVLWSMANDAANIQKRFEKGASLLEAFSKAIPDPKGIFKGISIFDFDPKVLKKGCNYSAKTSLEEDGRNLPIVLKKINSNSKNRQKLKRILEQFFPQVKEVQFESFKDKSTVFKIKETFDRRRGGYLHSPFISDGTANIIALMIATEFGGSHPVIIEEPERNMHPKLMNKLMEMMKSVARSRQIITTTHNPEFIKWIELDSLLLIHRDPDGFSNVVKPAEIDQVRVFVENNIGIESIFVNDIFGV